MCLFCFLLLAGLTLANGKISFTIISQAEQNGFVNITVSFSGSGHSAIKGLAQVKFQSREERLNFIYETLTKEADLSQKGVLSMLKYRPLTNPNTKIRRFWITNQMVIRNADKSLIKIISEDPQVSDIEEEEVAMLHNPVSSLNLRKFNKVEWNIKTIQAPEAWDYGYNGSGIIVGILDSGVRVSHEALRDNYLGKYGWYDPNWNTENAFDTNYHGTHVAGTILGSRIGVAPSAKFSACVGCAGLFCSYADLLGCGQFFLCPTLPDGSEPDCSKAPHIINNSWGGGRGSTFFNKVIDAWREAGIIPVFSIGNSGPDCGTASYPGDNPKVIGVGSTTITNAIARHSSLGPTLKGNMKPDIVAPGEGITSAHSRWDGAYQVLSGTSMAAPHVSGVIALMMSANIHLTFNEIRKHLVENAEKCLSFNKTTCNRIRDSVFPNHVFGSGRVDALKCLKAVGEGSGNFNWKTIDFFTEKDHEGELMRFEVKESRDCHFFKQCWNDKASSVNTHGTCVMIYKHGGCVGKSQRIARGTPWHGDLERLGMDKMISSFRLC